MITSKYNELLEGGLLLDHFYLLSLVYNKIPLPESKRVQGFLNLLTKKGYIEDDQITEKGITLIQDSAILIPNESIKSKDFDSWVDQLHTKIEDRIIGYTGRKQIRPKLGAKSYSFVPNKIDLGKVLLKVVKLYKLADLDKVESTILKYIDSCHTEGEWFPILQYYIMKDGASRMVTDMETVEEATVDSYTSTQKFM